MIQDVINIQDTSSQYWLNKLTTATNIRYTLEQALGKYEPAYKQFVLAPALIETVHYTSNGDELAEWSIYVGFYAILLHKFFGLSKGLIASTNLQPDSEQSSFPVFSMSSEKDKKLIQVLETARGELEETLHHRPMSHPAYIELSGMKGKGPMPWQTFGFLVVDHQQDTLPFSPELTLLVNKKDHSIGIRYNALAWPALLIEKMGAAYAILLEQGLANLNSYVKEAAFMPFTASQEKLSSVKNLDADNKKNCLAPLLETITKKHAERVALIGKENRLSFAAIDQQSGYIAQFLLNQVNLHEGAVVGLMMPRSHQMIITLLGIWKAGLGCLPIDPEEPLHRVNFMLADNAVTLILCDGEPRPGIPKQFQQVDINLISQQAITIEQAKTAYTQARSAAYIFYTSDAMRNPHKMIVNHRQLYQLAIQPPPFAVNGEDTHALFQHTAAQIFPWQVLMPLVSGGRLVIAPARMYFNSPEFIHMLQKEQVSILSLTPDESDLFLTSFQALEEPCNCSLRYVCYWGETPGLVLQHNFTALFPKVSFVSICTMPEAGGPVAWQNNTISKYGGQPFGHLQIDITNEDGQLLPEGCIGNITFRGADIIHTKELGSIGAGGELLHLGKKDREWNLPGGRIAIQELETFFKAGTGLQYTIWLSTTNAAGKQELVAFYKGPTEKKEEEIQEWIKANLPPNLHPVRLHLLPAFPLNTNGRPDQHALLEIDKDSRKRNTLVPAANPIEESLLTLWKEALKVKDISVEDDFFAVGGNSIRVIRLVTLIQQNISHSVEVQDLFEHRTIRSCATFISQADRAATVNILIKRMEEQLVRLREEAFGQDILPTGQVEDIYPMSDIEKGMVFANLYYGKLGVYHTQHVYPIQDDHFQPDLLQQALNILVSRHAILRTAFYMDLFSQPMQVVYTPEAMANIIRHTDISHLPAEQQTIYLEEVLQADREQAFDLKQPGLWRLQVYTLNHRNHVIIWSFHHAILDGWSNGLFIAELGAAYTSLITDGETIRTTPQTTYRDYVIEQLIAAGDKELHEYWQHYLAGHQRTPLPFKQTQQGPYNKAAMARSQYHFNEKDARAIKNFAARHQLSLRELLFAGFLYMLRVSTGRTDLTVGLVTHNRPGKNDSHLMLGCFLNTIPFRIQMPETDFEVSAFLQAVKEQMRQLKKYEQLSFMTIVKTIGGQSSAGNPVFDLKFDFTDPLTAADLSEKTAALQDDHIIQGNNRTNTDFDFNISATHDSIRFSITWPTQAYTREEVHFIRDLYLVIMEALVSETKISYEQLISRTGFHEYIDGVNDTTVHHGNDSFVELFRLQAATNPDQPALYVSGTVRTYRELDQLSDNLAAFMLEQYAGCNGHVAILLPRSEEFVVSMLAVLKAGWAFIPVDPTFSGDRISFILEDADVELVLSDHYGCFELTGFYKGRMIAVDIQLPGLPSAKAPQVNSKGDDIAYLIYTSGSTGRPKGTMITHKAVANYVQWCRSTLHLSENDRALVFSSVAFDLSFTTLLTSLISGTTLYIFPVSDYFDADAWRSYIVTHSITCVKLTPSHFSLLLAHPDFPEKFAGNKMRLFIIGGERLRPADIGRYLNHYPGTQFINHYGPTETTIGVITQDVMPAQLQYLAMNPVIGRPTHNHQVFILNDRMEPVGPGQVGEICIGGAGLAKGYYKNEALTAEKFIQNSLTDDRIYRTGDIGSWLPNGLVAFHGRLDDQVKVRGYRVEPAETELQLKNIPGIRDAKVLPIVDEAGEMGLAAFLLLDQLLTETTVRNNLRKVLPEYMIPAVLKTAPQFPLTPNGKIDTAALRSMELPFLPTDLTTEPDTADETELSILEIWKEILQRHDIGVNTKFFDLGGNSITLVQLASKLTGQMQSQLTVADLFNYTTVKEIADRLKQSHTALASTIGIEI